MMRIAYVCADPGVPVFGRKGCSVHVQEMLRAFLNRGVAIDLFAAGQGGECPTDLRNVRLHELNEFRHPADANDVQRVHKANAALVRELESRQPFDLIYERYSLWSDAGMQFAQTAGVPGVLEVNAPLIEEQARYRRLNAPELAQRIAEKAFESATVICAVSSQVANYLEGFPRARGRIHMIPNGVDPARFQRHAGLADASAPCGQIVPPKSFVRKPQDFTIGFVGSLKPWHGLSTLAEGFARHYRPHSNTRLLIVGDGPERENLMIQLAAEGSDVLRATHLTGAVPSEDVPYYLSLMDVAVAPYPALTGFYFSPLKIFEYMASGLPVVASRIGDLPEILHDGANGILHAPGDAVELAARLDQLRSDPTLRRRLGEAARATVLQRYTWKRIVEQVLSLSGVIDTPNPELPLRRASHAPSAVNA